MFSGKIILYFAILENLRIFQNCLFTGGVVKANGICSAAFYESAALWGKLLLGASGLNPLRHRCAMPPPPKGEVLLYLPEVAEKLPRGELSRSD